MSNYFEKYTSNDKPDIVLYKDILLDLIKEVEVNYVALIEQSTDILNIEYMQESFLLDWLAFYGLDLPDKEVGSYNRNSLKRWRFFLRHRGEEQTLYSVFSSGGALFGYNQYPLKIYWWDTVPEWIERNPKDGIIYILCDNRNVIKENDLIKSVTPAGYTYDIVYNPEGSNFGVFVYYGDLRFDYGHINGQMQPSIYGQQGYHPNEYALYKHTVKLNKNEETGEYEDEDTVFGNFGSEEYNDIKNVTLDSSGRISSWAQMSDFPSQDYPSTFDANSNFVGENQTPNTPRDTYSTEQLTYLFKQYVQYGENDEGEWIIPLGHFSNRTTVISRENLYFVTNGYVGITAENGDGSIGVHTSNEYDLVVLDGSSGHGYNYEGFYIKKETIQGSNLVKETLRSDGSYSGDNYRIAKFEVPYNTRLDKKILIRYKVSRTDTSKAGSISVYLNYSSDITYYANISSFSDSDFDTWKDIVIELSDNLSNPNTVLEFEYYKQSNNINVDFDLSNICIKKPVIDSERETSSPEDVIAKEDILFHRNWSFETFYRNNLSMENLYNQYNKNDADKQYNPPQLGIQPEVVEDGVYKYIPMNTDWSSSNKTNLIRIIQKSNNLTLQESKALVDPIYSSSNTVTEDFSILWNMEANQDVVVTVLSEQNYNSYNKSIKTYWPFSALPDGPATSKWWPPLNLMMGLKHHWSFGDTTTFDGTDDVETGGVDITNNSLNVDGLGKIDSCVKIGSYGYGTANIAKVIDKNKEWSISFWLNTSSTSTGYRGLLSLCNNNNPSASGAKFFGIGIKNNQLSFATDSSNIEQMNLNISTGSWGFIAITHEVNENTVKVYSNDSQALIANIPNDFDLNNIENINYFRIGYGGVSWTIALNNTLIDELAIWDRKLIRSEVLKLYNNGKGISYDYYSKDVPDLYRGVQHHYSFGTTSAFDGTDSVTGGVSLTNSGLSPTTSGKINSGVLLATASTYASNTITPIIGLNKNWSVAFWCKSTYDYANIASILYFGTTDAQTGFYIGNNRTKLCIATSQINYVESSLTIDSTFAFFVITHEKNANTVNIYHNGNTAVSCNLPSGIGNAVNGTFRVGTTPDGVMLAQNHTLDEVSLWNRVLSEEEATMLYNGGSGAAYEDWGNIIPEPTPVPEYTLLSNLEHHWSFGNTSSFDGIDSVSSYNDTNPVTLINDSTNPASVSTSGKINSCLSFTGSSQKVSCNTSSSIVTTDKDWSISFWIKLNSNSGDHSICLIGDRNNNAFFAVCLYNTVFSIRTSESQFEDCNNYALTTGVWNHCVITYKKDTKQVGLYKNGTLVENHLISNFTNTGGTDVILGYSINLSVSGIADALLDEFSIWSRELSAAEVTELYNSGNGLAFENYETPSISKWIAHHYGFGNTLGSLDLSDSVTTDSADLVNDTTNYLRATDKVGRPGASVYLYNSSSSAKTTMTPVVGLNKAWSVGFWSSTVNEGNENRSIISFQTSNSSTKGFSIAKYANNLRFIINGTDITTTADIHNITATTAYCCWKSIIVTHKLNENFVSIYIGNNDPINIQISGLGNASGGQMIVGCAENPGLLGSAYYIDELSIWNKELSPKEVELFYNNGNGLEYADWDRTTVPWMDYCLMPDPAVTTAAGYMYIFKKGTYNGKECVMTDFTFVPTGTTTVAYCRFYFRLEAATTLTFKYMHHTTNNSYLAFRLDSASSAAFLAVNTDESSDWVSYSKEYSAGEHYIQIRNAININEKPVDGQPKNFACLDLSEFYPYMIIKKYSQVV